MSWKPALRAHNEERFSTNGLTFEFEHEAKASAWNTFYRAFAFDEYKAIEVSTEEFPITHRWDLEKGNVNLADEALTLGHIVYLTPPETLTNED